MLSSSRTSSFFSAIPKTATNYATEYPYFFAAKIFLFATVKNICIVKVFAINAAMTRTGSVVIFTSTYTGFSDIRYKACRSGYDKCSCDHKNS